MTPFYINVLNNLKYRYHLHIKIIAFCGLRFFYVSEINPNLYVINDLIYYLLANCIIIVYNTYLNVKRIFRRKKCRII